MDTAVGAGACPFWDGLGFPAPEPLPKAGISTAGSFLCWWFCSGEGNREGREGHIILYLFPSISPELLDAYEVPGTFLLYQMEKLHSDDRGRS